MTATSPEQHPATSDARERIFLSPRVLDQAAFEEFSEVLGQLLERAQEHGAHLAEMVRSAERAGPRMERLAETQRAAIKSAGDTARQAGEVRAMLAQIEERARSASESERRMSERAATLEATVLRAESAVARAEHLLERVESLHSMGESAARAAERAEEARRALEASAVKADEAAERVARALGEYLGKSHELAAPLASERAAAEHAAEQLRAAADECRALLARGVRSEQSLRAALGELDPWRGVLLDGRQDAQLPPMLQRMVEELRGGILRDLSEMALAMRRVAERTPCIEHKPGPTPTGAPMSTRPAAPAPLAASRVAGDVSPECAD